MSDERQKIELPAVVEDYLAMLTRRIRNRCVRRDVLAELRGHFDEALADVAPEDRERTARELIDGFGDASALSALITRAKKRCRPGWMKFTIRSLQVLGVLILLLIAYAISFWFDKPNPAVDYVAEFNDMVRAKAVQSQADESENAAPYYLKAEELLSEPSKEMDEWLKLPGKGVTPEQEQVIRKWLNENQRAFDALAKGAAKPYFQYEYTGQAMTAIQLPYLSKFRFLAECLCWRMWLIDGEDQEKILKDLYTLYGITRHLKSNGPTIIEQVVGIAIESLVDYQVLSLLQAEKIKPESLPALARVIANLYPKGYVKADFRGERMMCLDMVQQVFTNGGFGGGHLCPRSLKQFLNIANTVSGRPEDIGGMKLLGIALKNGLYLTHPRRETTVRKLNAYFDLLNQYADVLPYDRSHQKEINPQQFIEGNLDNIFLKVFLPALSRVVDVDFRSYASFQAMQTVVALRRYKADVGRYPDSLAELSPKYLKELPRDPYGPGLLTYKKIGEDFKLYSLGTNFKDDGGMHDPKWGESTKDKAADYVFWPTEKLNR